MHETYFSEHGLIEQYPEHWWEGVCAASKQVMSKANIAGSRVIGVCGCGQMHAPILLDSNRKTLTKRAQLWNDKRAGTEVEEIISRPDYTHLVKLSGNPAATSWPGFKLMWIANHTPEILDQADVVLMPKDYINFQLCGEVGQERTEAGSSFLYDTLRGQWSAELARALDVPVTILPDLNDCWGLLGKITQEAANATGIPSGTPVFAGGGDYPIAVFGSGAYRVGDASDVTGTSSLLSILNPDPVVSSEIMNAAAPSEFWKAFAVVDAAGDAIRWGRRELEENAVSFEHLSTITENVPAGSNGMIFMPYLTGERLGFGRSNRAAFLGLTAAHGKPQMHRAILEGTALALKSAAAPLFQQVGKPEVIIASGGGARSQLLLQIKASIFNVPIVPVAQVECGLVGAAALAMTGLGVFADVGAAIDNLVHHAPPVLPDPDQVGFYQELSGIFNEARNALRETSARLSSLGDLDNYP